MTSGPSWDNLHAFLDIARSPSLGAAARRSGVTTSAMSQRLSTIEKQVGMQLVHRSSRGLKLTEAGQALRAGCEQMERAAQCLLDDGGREGQMRGSVRLSCPVGLIDALIVPMLTKLLLRNPGVSLEIVASDEHVDLKKLGIDVALRFGWTRDGDYFAKKLASFEEFVCASPEYLQRRGLPQRPEDLAAHDWIGYAGFGARQRLTFRHRTESSVRVSIGCRVLTSSSTSIAHWLCAGAGISRQPAPVVQSLIEAGRVTRVLASWELPGPSLYAVYNRTTGAPHVREIVSFLGQEMRSATMSGR